MSTIKVCGYFGFLFILYLGAAINFAMHTRLDEHLFHPYFMPPSDYSFEFLCPGVSESIQERETNVFVRRSYHRGKSIEELKDMKDKCV